MHHPPTRPPYHSLPRFVQKNESENERPIPFSAARAPALRAPALPSSTIKALLDTQAEHQQQMAAQEKQIRDVQAFLVGSRKKSSSDVARCREEAARAAAAAVETAAGFRRLREGVSAARVRRKSTAGGWIDGGMRGVEAALGGYASYVVCKRILVYM